jgi:transposase
MRRRRFIREFKVEALKLVRESGVSAAQAARDLDVHEKEFGSDPVQAFRPWADEAGADGD